eukprot:scaffold21750_cov128-Isochrysis_galbana.AAC.5
MRFAQSPVDFCDLGRRSMAGDHGQEHKRAPDSKVRSLCVLPPASVCRGCMCMPPPSLAPTICADDGRRAGGSNARLASGDDRTGLRPEMARCRPESGRQRAT